MNICEDLASQGLDRERFEREKSYVADLPEALVAFVEPIAGKCIAFCWNMELGWHERVLEGDQRWLVDILSTPVPVGAELSWEPIDELDRIPF